MRGLDTPVRKMRLQVFEEVARVADTATKESLIEDIEAIPYKLITEDTERYKENVYRVRAIVREQVRLAM